MKKQDEKRIAVPSNPTPIAMEDIPVERLGVAPSEQGAGLSGSALRSGPEDGTPPTIPNAPAHKPIICQQCYVPFQNPKHGGMAWLHDRQNTIDPDGPCECKCHGNEILT